MSHSRIMILEDSAYDCDRIFDEMSIYGVDYVTESKSEYSEDFDWVMGCMSNWGFVPNPDKNGFELESVDTFWNAMTALGEGKYFWIYYDGELYTLPQFVKFYKPHRVWRISKFLDYHF